MEMDVPGGATVVQQGLPNPFGYCKDHQPESLHFGDCYSLGKRDIDSVEGHDQVVRAVNLFKGADDSGLLPELPNSVLVAHTVMLNHCEVNDEQR